MTTNRQPDRSVNCAAISLWIFLLLDWEARPGGCVDAGYHDQDDYF